MKQKNIACSIIIMALLMLFSGCTKSQNPSKTTFLLDTIITITLYDSSDQDIINECFDLIAESELIFSRSNPSSELFILNQALSSGKGAMISDELLNLIQEGLYYSELSEGAFDITIAPVSSMWDFKAENPMPPSPELIKSALKAVDYSAIKADGNFISSSKPSQLDLGAIAKGYIADKVKLFMESKGVTSATINLGGNVLCIGNKPSGEPFNIGVRNPYSQSNEIIALIKSDGKSVVTSGTYERYFDLDGTRYHHILNPKTGYPSLTPLDSVTILSSSSLDGDALSTLCFVIGKEKAISLLNNIEGTYGMFIEKDGTISYSDGFPK